MTLKSLGNFAKTYPKSSVAVAVCVMLAATIVTAGTWSRTPAKASASAGAAQGPPASRRPGVLQITLRQHGFEPAEVTRAAGLYILAVDDRSGLDAVSFSLQREAGGRVRERRARGHRRDWHEVIDLTPGNYVLSVDGQPNRACRITITPR